MFIPLLVFFLIFGCDQNIADVNPGKLPPQERTNYQFKQRQVPYTAIPRPYTETMYFLYGYRVTDNQIQILEQLLQANIPLQEAWYPDYSIPSVCMVLIPDQMIVKLRQPDSSIFNFGFVQDSSDAMPGLCLPYWFHVQVNLAEDN